MRHIFDSPVGRLIATESDGAIVALDWAAPGSGPTEPPSALLQAAARQLSAYFHGQLTAFDLPLAPRGTAFQQRVWRALLAIPYGEMATYGDLARTVGSAPRAVGGACGRNPIPVVIPCHRVVAGNGGLGGYSGANGLDTKRFLLDHERGVAMRGKP